MGNLQRATIDMPQPRKAYFRMKRSKFQGLTTLFVLTLTMTIGCESRLKSPDQSLLRVRVEVARIVSCPVTKSLTGKFRASLESDMSFRTSGRIEQRIAEVGQHVSVGDLLARLDSIQQAADGRQRIRRERDLSSVLGSAYAWSASPSPTISVSHRQYPNNTR